MSHTILSRIIIQSNESEKVLRPFRITFSCEVEFSYLAVLKNKYRNRLNPRHDVQCTLFVNLTSRINLLKNTSGYSLIIISDDNLQAIFFMFHIDY